MVKSMSTENEDIKRVLALCFRGQESLDALDLERMLSFDMGWLTPDQATEAVQALIRSGWLTGDEENLTPVESFQDSITPLGWHPRPERLYKPIAYNQETASDLVGETTLVTPKVQQKKSIPNLQTADDDPRARTTKRLLKFIARSSGLSAEEVQRRAARKQRALQHVTAWMALALVAREQGLEMNSVIEALS
jgi:hypothetical protein